ncbi:MAG: flagellar biosynthetic protein FlhB [Methylotenera sp.]|uniref:flagellar biosynthesis protein FlhB n=1 Tax=Methylotenera sp. TaxID=2051956 RepID=UPI000D45E62D|nr:flagellar biosynthesis protein FlhB [Methylotenera sp.]PPC82323.1 MAG: flagellar biosynthetic protein FlhB [Methylotenera sp.]
MAEESDLEKTESASPKRLEKAREEGDVPRSRELATVSVLLAAGFALLMMGGNLGEALKLSMSTGLTLERAYAYDPMMLLMRISDNIFNLLIAFSPLAIVLFVVAIASPALIGGWVFSEKALAPKFSKLNPITGFSNMFSKNSLAELVKSVGKAFLVGIVSYIVIANDMESILSLSLMPLSQSIAEVNDLLLYSFLAMVGALVFIAAIDVPFQLYQYAEKLKMTKEEVKRESKESDGNPEIKSRIRQQQREMSRRRMMSEIPNADVVITNPTHYAVAIQYKEGGMRAPVVIAKGADALALKIREIADTHKILIVESPKLARAIYAHTELEHEIPEALYTAVAEILAYVFQMRIFKKDGGTPPEIPSTLPVPDELDPHSFLPLPSVDDALDEPGAFI